MEKYQDMDGKTPFIKEIEKHRGADDNGTPESDRQFAARMGVSPSMLKHWHLNSSKPSLETVAYKVVPGLKLNTEEGRRLMNLATEVHIGEGRLEASVETAEEQRSNPNIAVAANVPDKTEFMPIPEMASQIGPNKAEPPTDQGGAINYLFNKEWLRSFCSGTDDLFFLDVEDSAMEPTLNLYDTVIVDTGQKIIQNGKLYAIGEGQRVVVRRLQRGKGRFIKIVVDNLEAGSSRDVNENSIRIVGQVVWVGRILI